MANESAFDNVVASGLTGVITNTTAYGVLAAGTTATSDIQNVGTGNAGQVLTSNGAAALPSFEDAVGGGEGAKMWVNLDGDGVIAINVSYNVTSITDNDDGDYTITIATDFSSANYCTQLNAAPDVDIGEATYTTDNLTAGTVRVLTADATGTIEEDALVDVVCFGAQ